MDGKRKVAMLPSYDLFFFNNGRIDSLFDLQPVYRALNKLKQWLWPVKDLLGLQTLGIYTAPCLCEKVYIGQANGLYCCGMNSRTCLVYLAGSAWKVRSSGALFIKETSIISKTGFLEYSHFGRNLNLFGAPGS